MNNDLTASWLKQNIALYRNSNRVYIDTLAVLEQYPSLRPKTDVYTYDDGRSQLLLCVHGLVPIAFRNASYNIPVAIWVTLAYPAEPPLVYVVPTSDMLIKPSPRVDLSGRCSFEYTENWVRKPDSCSIQALIEAMRSHFSAEPPLYSKPRPKLNSGSPGHVLDPSHSQNVPSASEYGHVHQLPGPPRLPPKPFNNSGIVSTTPSVIPTTTFSGSPSPPYPPTTRTPIRLKASVVPAYASSVQSAAGADPTPVNLHERLPPPVPPHPPELTSSHPLRAFGPPPVAATLLTQTSNQTAQGLDTTGPPPYTTAYSSNPDPRSTPGTSTEQYQAPVIPPRPPVPLSTPTHGYQQRADSLHLPANVVSSSTIDSPPPPLPALPSHPSHAYTRPQSQPKNASGLIATEETGRSTATTSTHQVYRPADANSVLSPLRPAPSLPVPDLLDEEDTLDSSLNLKATSFTSAPPKPPNPQTLALHSTLLNAFRDALSRMSITHEEAVARQRAAQAELLKGPAAINDESARLTAVRDVCRAVGERWSSLLQEGEKTLGEVKRRGEVEVDEMVCASSIVGNQLVNLVAEDNAIEDTMYYLHRALNSGRIDLERFLRTTRVLAEEQFMKRALVEKIVNGLPIRTMFGP